MTMTLPHGKKPRAIGRGELFEQRAASAGEINALQSAGHLSAAIDQRRALIGAPLREDVGFGEGCQRPRIPVDDRMDKVSVLWAAPQHESSIGGEPAIASAFRRHWLRLLLGAQMLNIEARSSAGFVAANEHALAVRKPLR